MQYDLSTPISFLNFKHSKSPEFSNALFLFFYLENQHLWCIAITCHFQASVLNYLVFVSPATSSISHLPMSTSTMEEVGMLSDVKQFCYEVERKGPQ